MRPNEEKVAEPNVTRTKDGPEISPGLHVKCDAADKDFNDDGGHRHEVVRENARGEHRPGADGRETETAKNSLLAECDELHAESPEAPHHGHREDRAQDVRRPSHGAICEDQHEEEEEAERHDQAEKQECAVAHGEAHADFCQRPGIRKRVRAHYSRSLRPVSSMKTSSSDGENISRLCSSLFSASSCFTSATIVCGGLEECST